MSLSPILDVIIGLAGVYAAFSLLASWCNERAAALLDLRSKGLVNGIYQLLNGDRGAFTKFVSDPMFRALQHAAQNTIPPAPPKPSEKAVAATQPEQQPPDPNALAKTAPSYLSSAQFSAIFMNVLATKSAELAKSAAAATTVDSESGVTPVQSVASATTDALQGVQAAADQLGVGPQVNALLLKAGGDKDQFIAGVESWYDDHMDRVSGWYKRESHKILALIGAGLVLFFNLDSIRLYEGLSCNSALRGAVSAAGEKNAGTQSDFVQGMLQAIPLGWKHQSGSWKPDDPIRCYAGAAAGESIASGTAANAPAGRTPPSAADTKPTLGAKVAEWAAYLFLKGLGLGMTVIALSLGAPFWFDALSCLTNVRAAGKKPDSNGQATK